MDPLSKTFRWNMSNTKLKLSDLNPHLMCVLCGGYYIDATTIVECLHSFCRSCIVKHLESSKYCPICEVQVHKTKPLINIRPDKTLQDIVYKLVPGLFANEMRNRRKFYRERPHYIKPNNSESVGEVSGDRKMYINDENITFSLVYHTGVMSANVGESFREITSPIQEGKRYFKCPTGVTIYHLKKLLKTKYDLNDSNYKMEVYLKDQPLHEDLTLLDISYIYLWKNKGSLDLTYKIFENVVKRQRLEEPKETAGPKEVKEEESGHGELKMERLRRPEALPNATAQKQNENSGVNVANGKGKIAEAKSEEPVSQSNGEIKIGQVAGSGDTKQVIKENGVTGNEMKEIQLQISESGVMSVSQVQDREVVRTMEEGPSLPAPQKTTANTSHVITGASLSLNKGTKINEGSGEGAKPQLTTVSRLVPESQQQQQPQKQQQQQQPQKQQQQQQLQKQQQQQQLENQQGEGKERSKPVKPYKTIRYSPKSWHPVIPKEKLRPTLMKNSEEPKKPLKFFKMRNMPRFLGNPSSGVKPMYAEPVDANNANPEKKKKPSQVQEKKPETGTKNKILRIDPKTLRPIEKEELKVTQAPNLPNLMTNPFIPNNNHFLFSDLHLLPPNSGNFSNCKTGDGKAGSPGSGVVGAAAAAAAAAIAEKASPVVFKGSVPNGSYPPICFPSPEHNPAFYPFSNLAKPQSFPFAVSNDKMDPLLRASRLSPFGNLAGFHASLPPSISRLLNPHQHFRKINQSLEKKNKDESTKETNKSCDYSIKVDVEGKDKEKEKTKADETTTTTTTTTRKEEKKKKEESNKNSNGRKDKNDAETETETEKRTTTTTMTTTKEEQKEKSANETKKKEEKEKEKTEKGQEEEKEEKEKPKESALKPEEKPESETGENKMDDRENKDK